MCMFMYRQLKKLELSFNVSQGTVTEDCLMLSVHIPSGFTVGSNQQNLLPVMVWIHGGAYILGSSTDKMFDNTTELCNSTNTIIVSINYRLGKIAVSISFHLVNTCTKGRRNMGKDQEENLIKMVKISRYGGIYLCQSRPFL